MRNVISTKLRGRAGRLAPDLLAKFRQGNISGSLQTTIRLCPASADAELPRGLTLDCDDDVGAHPHAIDREASAEQRADCADREGAESLRLLLSVTWCTHADREKTRSERAQRPITAARVVPFDMFAHSTHPVVSTAALAAVRLRHCSLSRRRPMENFTRFRFDLRYSECGAVIGDTIRLKVRIVTLDESPDLRVTRHLGVSSKINHKT